MDSSHVLHYSSHMIAKKDKLFSIKHEKISRGKGVQIHDEVLPELC